VYASGIDFVVFKPHDFMRSRLPLLPNCTGHCGGLQRRNHHFLCTTVIFFQVGQLLATSATDDPANVGIYAIAFYLTTLGIIYVQEAERRIPINYSGRWVMLAVGAM